MRTQATAVAREWLRMLDGRSAYAGVVADGRSTRVIVTNDLGMGTAVISVRMVQQCEHELRLVHRHLPDELQGRHRFGRRSAGPDAGQHKTLSLGTVKIVMYGPQPIP